MADCRYVASCGNQTLGGNARQCAFVTSGWWFSRSRFMSTFLLLCSHIFTEVMVLRISHIIFKVYKCNFYMTSTLIMLPLHLQVLRWLVNAKLPICVSVTEAAVYYGNCLYLLHSQWRDDQVDLAALTSVDGPDNGFAQFSSIVIAAGISWAGGRYVMTWGGGPGSPDTCAGLK
eukprot:gnl/TRDRNA2_/TRDRNA2_160764_c0_seq1.p1 gnl/TRDRNA2_/TRDRNA2_160764_c0~~gnl/TRDRNA2_/TRDRNA2_160764_c0_seq1.p1  ORF type:complete len:174 (-),score=1.30 gnl/TRDRNA2_/TRDRNA2_160764_c0_seq1:62-583(-)